MKYAFLIIVILTLVQQDLRAQDSLSVLDRITHFPARFLNKTQEKASRLNDQLVRQTERYLKKLEKQERNMQHRLAKVDSVKAKQLFVGGQQKYQQLLGRLKADNGQLGSVRGEYLPYVDSLKTSLIFLQKHQQVLDNARGIQDKLQRSLKEVNELKSKLRQTEQIKAFIQERKEQLQQAFSQYTRLPKSITSSYDRFTRQAYYYSAQVKSYKEMLNDPDQLSKKALSLLNKLPAFQQFMQQHSDLAALFPMPAGYGTPQSLQGLQTRSQVQDMLQSRLAAGGPNAGQMLQQNIQQAQAQMNQLKDKINKLGGGSSDINIPDFKPNTQRTRTFLQRLEYGMNLQSQKANGFFPTTSDIGLSVGYKLNDKSTIGVGASYKMGLVKDISHINFSSEGVGLRSFVDVKLKGSFYASGGLEYNYQQPFYSLQQVHDLNTWQQSGLVGISKIISMKTKVFKKTKVQLLWDFLSYQQRPQAQALKFSVGYNF